MNPSIQDMLQAVEFTPTDEVIILPNNPDILPPARQVNGLTRKTAVVIPSRTMPQGINALLTFDQEADLNTNIEAMTNSLPSVRTGKLATATRSMRYKGVGVQKGQIIGFVDEELVLAAHNIEDTFRELLEKMGACNGDILTLYYGNDANRADTEGLLDPVRERYPNIEIEIVFGGQPHYHYIISVE